MKRFGATLNAVAANLPVRRSAAKAGRSLGMAGEWPTLSLREAQVKLIDCDHRTPPASDAGYPYVAIPQLRNGRIDLSEARRISREHFVDWTRKAMPAANDVVLSRRCNPGETAFVPPELEFALGQNLVLLRADGVKVYPPFLRWLVQGPEWWKQIGKFLNVGAVFDSLRCADVPNFELRIPPMPEQRAIAHILGTLDDKIELNRRMNETLEAMAWAFFKSWFVDFDPVRAKAEGRDPGLPKPLADFFPDSFEDSELGEIPKGWEIGTLGDIADHPRRGVRPNDIEPTIPYIALEHMPRRCIALSDWGAADGLESNKFKFKKGEILFGKLRPYFHKVGVAPVDGVCSTDIVVVTPRKEEWFGFVLGHISSDTFVEYTNAGSSGTRMPRTSWSEMARYRVVVPPESVNKALTLQIRPVVDHIIASIHESRTLAALRDALLPKLISGELRLKATNNQLQSA
jgi:type I restriction enzyme S subunit